MNLRRYSIVALAVLGGSCSSQPAVIAVRNLERPSDMGFVCMVADGNTISGRPMTDCHRHLFPPGDPSVGPDLRSTSPPPGRMQRSGF